MQCLLRSCSDDTLPAEWPARPLCGGVQGPRRVRLALACLALLQAAVAHAHVYGIDRRVQRDADTLPYRAVGTLVEPRTGNGGTAFLVGRCHVVSAHHVPYAAGASRDPANLWSLARRARFQAGPQPGKARVFTSSTIATVVDAGRFTEDDFAGAAGDWAILRLDNCLGDRYGWLRIDRDTTPESLPGTTLTSIGYPRSRARRPGVTVETGCRARDFGPAPGIFGVDCAFERGMSGGPLLARQPDGTWRVVGVISQSLGTGSPTEYSMANRNQAVHVSAFRKALDRVLGAETRRTAPAAKRP
ncbi:trypsin-like serine peptidase [Ramlibacter tataouinensis]|uniref:trypsin-like serine peptidase n=1 Tax=Ramlibacter tataouinensis TaxID=94132 RepID=UPI0009EEC20D|nr:serine protease [Ramlibacter tataouinensis]